MIEDQWLSGTKPEASGLWGAQGNTEWKELIDSGCSGDSVSDTSDILTDDWLNFMLKSSEFYSVYYPSSRFFKNQNNSKMTWVSVFGPHSKCTGLITGSELRDHFWKVLMGLCGTRIKPSAFTCKQCLTCNTVSQAPIMCFLIFYIVYSCKWLFLLL